MTPTLRASKIICMIAVWGSLLSSRTEAVEISETTYQDRAHFLIHTSKADWYYDKAGGGFSRIVDRDGKDWIQFKKDPLSQYPASAAAGYRGLPNLVFGSENPDAGAGHPGFDRCTSLKVGHQAIRTTSRSGKWAWSWSFHDQSATMTMEKIDPEHAWWFLYEGTIAGRFKPDQQYWGTDRNAPSQTIPKSKQQHFGQWQRVFFGDANDSKLLFIHQHQQDDLPDTFWYLGAQNGGSIASSDGMCVFGFGRGPGTRPQFKKTFIQFTVGLAGLTHSGLPSSSEVQQAIDTTLALNGPSPVPPEPWQETPGTVQVQIPSSFDGALQKAIWHEARASETSRPLLVALHSWSGDFKQSSGIDYLSEANERDWHFIHPDFRGVNQRPAATCSDLVVSDILDAVTYARSIAKVDPQRIYLVGASGGGMASLMMAAKAPDVWAAVSAWVPISDLRHWHRETAERKLRYTAMIEASCGGAPGDNAAINFQYLNRSPISFLEHARPVNLDINTGIMDGHTGSVPVGHSLRAFNILASQDKQFTEKSIHQMEQNKAIPESLRAAIQQDPSYGEKQPLLRRTSGKTRITVFDGTHEIIVQAAIKWLASKKKE